MSEYRRRGALIPNPPDGWPIRRFCIELPDAPEYRQAFFGQLWELGNAWFWKKDAPGDDTDQIAAQIWREYMSRNVDTFQSQTDCDLTDLCLSYPNTASFIGYYPNDPRYTPDLVPEGYNNPPWYFATGAANTLYGTQVGDIITSLDRFPPGSLPTIIPASGLPTIAIRVNGAGRITVNLRTMYAGSKIQITKDNDPLTAYYVNVLRDVASLPPDTVTEIAVDIDFDTPGEHVAHLVVVSAINDQIPFLFHGAGLVSVDLCGLMPTLEETPMYGAVRLTDCGLEQLNTSTLEWEPIAQILPLTAGPNCELTDGLYINAPNANRKLVFRQQEDATTQRLVTVETADPNSANFHSFLYDTAQAAGPDAVTYVPFAYNLIANNTKENPADIGWAQQITGNFRQGSEQWSSMNWLYRGTTKSVVPLYIAASKVNDNLSWQMRGDTMSFINPANEQQILTIQAGVVRAWNNSIFSVRTNNVNAIQQLNAAGSAEISLLQLDTQDRTIIGRNANGIVLRGNPLLVAPTSDANPILYAQLDAGQRKLGFFQNIGVVKQSITGLTLDTAFNSLADGLAAYGLFNNLSGVLPFAPVVAVRFAGCTLEQSPDNESWGPVLDELGNPAYFLPLNVSDACNGVSLQDVPLEIQRVGGSTEAVNPILSLSAVGEGQLASLPMDINFSAQTDSQFRPVASIRATIVDNVDGAYKSEIALTAHDATQQRTILSGRANNTYAALGVLGAIPVSRQTIDYGDLTDHDLILAIGQAMHNFGFLNFVPCQPEYGDWAIEWRNAQIMQWPIINCGVFANGGLTSVANCNGADSGFGANLDWSQGNASAVVYMVMQYDWIGINPATGFQISCAKDPDGNSQILASDAKFTSSGSDSLEFFGDEDFDNIGMACNIQVAGPGSVTVTRVKIEGYGNVPPAEGGLNCG